MMPVPPRGELNAEWVELTRDKEHGVVAGEILGDAVRPIDVRAHLLRVAAEMVEQPSGDSWGQLDVGDLTHHCARGPETPPCASPWLECWQRRMGVVRVARPRLLAWRGN